MASLTIAREELIKRAKAAGLFLETGDESAEETQAKIINEILDAGTAEAILADVTEWKDILTLPLTITEVRFIESEEYEDSAGAYAVIRGTHGENVYIITCGGGNVMAQLLRLAELKLLPVNVAFHAAKGKNGDIPRLRKV